MAKHKKKRTKKVSKGERPSMNRSIVRAVRDDRSLGDKIMNKFEAWTKGKKGTVTIENPNAENEPDRRFIKVSFNRYFGNGLDYKSLKNGVKRSDDKNKVEF